ncbi:MAG: RrF2 family transcriptional regulator [Promethearchaeota archaeon]
MKVFSEKVNYGLSALFELAKNYYKGFIQIKEIATAQNIPQNYLEQLLINLKGAGLVESMRGAQGGYKLKRPASDIKIFDVIEALESPITILDYSKNSEVLKSYWLKIENEFKKLFDNTLEDLLNDEHLLKKRFFYQI